MASKSSQHKIQSVVDDYTNFVIDGLIGIKGRSRSDVLSHVVKSWIERNAELLREYDLSVQDWKNRDM